MLLFPRLFAEHWLDVVGKVELQRVSEVRIQNLDLIEQRVKDESHIVEHTFFTSLVALHSVQRVELDLELTRRMRAEVVDLDLLRDEIAVVSSLQFARVELNGSANDHVLLD